MGNIFSLILGGAVGLVIGVLLPRRMKEKDHLLIKFKLHQIMATQAQLAQELRDIKDQNEKARLEVLKKISDLETALANAGNTIPEVDEALAALKASVQTDDDIVQDEPPVTE